MGSSRCERRRGTRSGLEMMNKERDWIVSKLDEESIEYLRDLPIELNLTFGDVNIHAFHATPNSLFKVVQPDESDEFWLKN